jgi:hypothetical protein
VPHGGSNCKEMLQEKKLVFSSWAKTVVPGGAYRSRNVPLFLQFLMIDHKKGVGETLRQRTSWEPLYCKVRIKYVKLVMTANRSEAVS